MRRSMLLPLGLLFGVMGACASATDPDEGSSAGVVEGSGGKGGGGASGQGGSSSDAGSSSGGAGVGSGAGQSGSAGKLASGGTGQFPSGSTGGSSSGGSSQAGGGGGPGGSSSGGSGAGSSAGGSGGSGGSGSGAGGSGGSACVPACAGRVCGPDPVCGQSCGSCSGEATCTGAGQCFLACKPDCAGRVCGLDPVCGTSCGSCPGGASCNGSGQCEVPCTPTWQVLVPGVTSIGQPRIDAGGKIYASGGKGGGAWVGSFSTCNGALTKEKTVNPPWGLDAQLLGLTLSSGVLHGVGVVTTAADPGEGYYARFDQSLELLGDQPLFGSSVRDELYGVGVLPSGNVMMFGAATIADGVTPGFWGVKAKTDGNVCGFSAIDGGGDGRGLAVVGGSAYVAGGVGGSAVVARFDDGSCGAEDPCGCKPAEQATLALPGSEARAIVAVGSTLYIAGYVNPGDGNFKAFIARASTSPLVIEAPALFDPTGVFDGFLALATDGSTLFAAGGQGWAGETPLATSTALAAAYPLDLTADTQPLWTKTYPGIRAFFGADGAPGVGAILAGSDNAQLTLLRCSSAGCP